ncbi:MAG: DUF6062 family protein [Limisphaerales bacterium]
MSELESTALPAPVEAAGDSEPLRLYVKNKLALSERLRAVREIFKQGGNDAQFKRCEELMVKLAEDRFTLAVLGQFKRGKSSLMNAIIGQELLPVGVLPLTSAITILRFGPKERLLINYEHVSLSFSEEFPVQRLVEFVTEKENPGNRKRVKTATVELPLPFLRRGLEFVDTPGIGSAIEANTMTTLKFLPESDAALFVTSVDSPFSNAELEFLENIHQQVHKIFFIVNKTDLLDGRERDEVLDFVRKKIHQQTGAENVKMFPLSSRLGLVAKLNNNWSEILESGLTDLENDLARFLSNEKAAVFLAGIERAVELLEQDAAKLEISSDVASVQEPPVINFAVDLKTRGCPVCEHLSKVAFHFLATFQCNLVQSEIAREEFAEELGFCAFHVWQLESVSSPLGASVGLVKLAEQVSKILGARANSSNGHAPVKLIRNSAECHVCRLLRETEQNYLRQLAEFVTPPEGRTAYARSQGVCLRHLGLWLPFVPDDVTRLALQHASLRFEEMAEDMQSFSMKTEALRRNLRNCDEGDAYLRTFIHFAGAKSNSIPMSKEAEI